MVEEVNVVSIQDDDELEEDEIEPDSSKSTFFVGRILTFYCNGRLNTTP